MRAFWLTTLLMASSLANAAGEGAWQASAMGPVISQRGMAPRRRCWPPILRPGA